MSPDGATHHTAWRFGSIVMLAACCAVTIWVKEPDGVTAAVAIMIGYYMGQWIDPDLDHPWNTAPKQRMRALWRPLAWYASLYTWLMPGHRSKLTHAPVLSTAVRFIFFLWPVLVLGWFIPAAWPWIGLAFCGLAISDLVHIGMDRR